MPSRVFEVRGPRREATEGHVRRHRPEARWTRQIRRVRLRSRRCGLVEIVGTTGVSHSPPRRRRSVAGRPRSRPASNSDPPCFESAAVASTPRTMDWSIRRRRLDSPMLRPTVALISARITATVTAIDTAIGVFRAKTGGGRVRIMAERERRERRSRGVRRSRRTSSGPRRSDGSRSLAAWGAKSSGNPMRIGHRRRRVVHPRPLPWRLPNRRAEPTPMLENSPRSARKSCSCSATGSIEGLGHPPAAGLATGLVGKHRQGRGDGGFKRLGRGAGMLAAP
jgi:hypothetical protein